MWVFHKPQKTIQIGDIQVGGYPGKKPTLLIGSIFYAGHKILVDERKGLFDKERAESLIKTQEEYSDKTGLPHIIDIVGENPDAMKKYLDYITSITDAAISIGGTVARVRITALQHIREVGIKNAILYNSLSEPKEEELNSIREAGVKNAVLLAFNTRDFTTNGRIVKAKELLAIARNYSIENTLIDTCVLDIPTLGIACKAIYRIKDELGLPAGCGAHNAVGMWRGVKEKMGAHVIKPASAVATATAVAAGADFILYGPIDEASIVFPVVAMMDAAYSQLILEEGGTLDRSHPRYRIA